jgi:hypothetical protein
MVRNWMPGRSIASALALLLLGTVGLTAAAARADVTPEASATAAGPPAWTRTITLVTGDEVTVVNGDNIAIRRGPGRAGVQFTSQRIDGYLHVIPSDALSLLTSGRVDGRLFDLTTLLEAGVDNRRGDLPLIVEYSGGAAAKTVGARVTRDLPRLGAAVVRQDRQQTAALWQAFKTNSGVRRISRLSRSMRLRVPMLAGPDGFLRWWVGLGGSP